MKGYRFYMQECNINVLGTVYKIIPKELKNADIDGYTDNTSKEIVIRTDNANNVGNFDSLDSCLRFRQMHWCLCCLLELLYPHLWHICSIST